MIFVDTNVFMYAVGRPHPLQSQARRFFAEAIARPGTRLLTSAEVLQELLHAYLPVGRMETLDAALRLIESRIHEVWAVDEQDVRLARTLAASHPAMGARDLLHLSCCQRRNVSRVQTFDRGLAAAFRQS